MVQSRQPNPAGLGPASELVQAARSRRPSLDSHGRRAPNECRVAPSLKGSLFAEHSKLECYVETVLN